jgi:hypothetical protein
MVLPSPASTVGFLEAVILDKFTFLITMTATTEVVRKKIVAGIAMYSTVMLKRADPESHDVVMARVRRTHVSDGVRGVMKWDASVILIFLCGARRGPRSPWR